MSLLDSLLTRQTPESLRKHMARQHEGTYPRSLGIRGGYPSEDKIEEIKLIAWVDARRWLHDELPHLWRSIGPYGRAEVTETTDLMDRPALKIRVATGGWSGCESVIDVVLSHVILAQHCEERYSGGAYVFVVPHEEKRDG